MSKLIKIDDEIAQNLLTQGYHTTDNSKFYINANLYKDMAIFINAYNTLEVDEYVLEKEGNPYRKRRYGSFILDSKTSELVINEHKLFYQSDSLNGLYGGIKRNFAPMSRLLLANKFLQEVILTDFSKLPESDKSKSKKWFVGVQMFRIEATKDYSAEPSPEGVHQDGHYCIVLHMINKQNIKGGESSICDLNKNKINSLTLNSFMDSCYIKDEMVMHDVSTVTCIDNTCIGIRDMLVLDYELME